MSFSQSAPVTPANQYNASRDLRANPEVGTRTKGRFQVTTMDNSPAAHPIVSASPPINIPGIKSQSGIFSDPENLLKDSLESIEHAMLSSPEAPSAEPRVAPPESNVSVKRVKRFEVTTETTDITRDSVDSNGSTRPGYVGIVDPAYVAFQAFDAIEAKRKDSSNSTKRANGAPVAARIESAPLYALQGGAVHRSVDPDSMDLPGQMDKVGLQRSSTTPVTPRGMVVDEDGNLVQKTHSGRFSIYTAYTGIPDGGAASPPKPKPEAPAPFKEDEKTDALASTQDLSQEVSRRIRALSMAKQFNEHTDNEDEEEENPDMTNSVKVGRFIVTEASTADEAETDDAGSLVNIKQNFRRKRLLSRITSDREHVPGTGSELKDIPAVWSQDESAPQDSEATIKKLMELPSMSLMVRLFCLSK
jgi:hypothetical protein